MRAHLLLGCVVVAGLGCNSLKFAPVSGRVTLNGDPVAGATVSFEPMTDSGGGPSPPGSLGKTNEKGEFTLVGTNGQNGALVGKHRVRISLIAEQEGEERQRGKPVGEKLPRKFNTDSDMTFDVPAGGTTEANFPLTTSR